MDTNRLLNTVCRRHGIESNRALARFLKLDRTRITAYRAGRRTLDPDACLAVADALQLPRGYVLAVVQAERAKRTEHRREWLNVARQLKTAAPGVLLAAGVTAALFASDAGEAAHAGCILRKIPGDRRSGRPDRRRERLPIEPDRHTLPLIAA